MTKDLAVVTESDQVPEDMGRLRVLIVTTLYPNARDLGHAPFNRQQFSHLGRKADVEVVATVPWRFGRPLGRAKSRDIPRREVLDDLSVSHPRFVTIPGLSPLNAGFMTMSLAPSLLTRRLRGRSYDVVLGAYVYPDASAAVLLAEAMRLPVVVKCHGSDLNRVPEKALLRWQIEKILPRATRVVSVSQKLAERAVELGASSDRTRVVYNGIDRKRFQPRDRAEARRQLGLPLDREIVLYVGTLAEHKGAKDLLDASETLSKTRPNATVVFVGDGPLAQSIERAGAATPYVIAAGRRSHEDVATFMAACDLLCLPSWDEGMPNVVREAHASGRPVVASDVGGIPEAVFHPDLGVLVPAKAPERLADALSEVLSKPRPAAEDIQQRAVVPTWDESAEQLLAVLSEAAGR